MPRRNAVPAPVQGAVGDTRAYSCGDDPGSGVQPVLVALKLSGAVVVHVRSVYACAVALTPCEHCVSAKPNDPPKMVQRSEKAGTVVANVLIVHAASV